MQPYDRKRFGKAIDQLPAEGKGFTDLKKGLHELRDIVDGLPGKTVMFVLTDGTVDPFNTVGKTPKVIAREIAAKNDICIYAVSSARGDTEKELIRAVTSINACSRVVPLEAFYGRPGYLSGVLYDVKETSIVKLKLVEIKKEVPIVKPALAEQVIALTMDDIRFDFNRADIKVEHHDELSKLGKFLQENPSTYVAMDGYTDSVGPQEYNLRLSRRRVENVGAYLVERFNIDPFRVVTSWYGELNPTADNSTEAGRTLNRRVEIAVGGL
jgi:OOP family OmpA-OmpF porin